MRLNSGQIFFLCITLIIVLFFQGCGPGLAPANPNVTDGSSSSSSIVGPNNDLQVFETLDARIENGIWIYSVDAEITGNGVEYTWEIRPESGGTYSVLFPRGSRSNIITSNDFTQSTQGLIRVRSSIRLSDREVEMVSNEVYVSVQLFDPDPMPPAPEPTPTPTPPPTPTPTPTPPQDGAPYNIGNVPFSYSWPQVPLIDGAPINVSTMSGFQAAMRQSNVSVVVAPGTYTGNLVISGSNIDLTMSIGATINGSVRIDGSRIRWTGGNMVTGPLNVNGSSDLLFNNFHGTTTGHLNNFSVAGRPLSRVALVNTTLNVVNANSNDSWALYMMPVGNRDIILANTKLTSDGQNNRLQDIVNLVIVDSAFNADGRSGNGMRIHHETRNVYLRNNIIVGIFKMDPVNQSDNGTQVINGTFEQNTRYSNLNAFALNVPSNTGTIRNNTVFTSTGNNIGGEAFISPMAGSNNVLRAWNGSSLPDSSAYGAQR